MPVSIPPGRLRKILDKLYREYNFKERIGHDPIEFPHRYADSEDIEVAGFIASGFAYGKITLFKPVIERILESGGKRPAQFFTDFTIKKDAKYLKGVSYRFNKEKDVLCLVYMLGQALKEWGSLKNLFYHHYKPGHEDIRDALKGFVDFFTGINTAPVYGKNIKPSGLTHLLPSPRNGSACKRMNLFLRWMVRKKDIDLGIWVIPLDTHIARISRCIGLTKRSTSDWKTAEEITGALKKLDPDDPLKYDFALCHQGISGLCRGKEFEDVCERCVFYRA
jgi:uncharacterized protein (TIGR02757 family)